MIPAIFVLASLLLVSAALALVAAINLVPTDFGFTYAQVAAVLLSAGTITLAIGLATRVLNRQLRRMASALEDNLKVTHTPVEAPLTAPVAASHEAESAIETERPALGTVAAVGAAGIAAGALVAGSHVLADHAEAPGIVPENTHDAATPAVSDRMMEELESDLFALAPVVAETPVVEAPIMECPAQEALLPADTPTQDVAERDPAPLAVAEKALAAVEKSQFGQDFDLSPDFTLPLTLPPDPIPAPQPLQQSEPDGTVAQEPQPPEPQPPEPPPVEPAVEAVPAPQPGLIADADLAALAEDMLPPLAPISTLEVVGAYDSAGTRFTMYSDGSVTAAGPEGETRFRTLDDLRRHLGTHQG
ncbi:MAG: hypothetical protein CFE31_06430 [Rhizobiales bacterium PAR1]|nr:MAG: hypothetical protein CFE31_06430 [Rhizobiales bacterium PAR1]